MGISWRRCPRTKNSSSNGASSVDGFSAFSRFSTCPLRRREAAHPNLVTAKKRVFRCSVCWAWTRRTSARRCATGPWRWRCRATTAARGASPSAAGGAPTGGVGGRSRVGHLLIQKRISQPKTRPHPPFPHPCCDQFLMLLGGALI